MCLEKKNADCTCQQRKDFLLGWATAFAGWCRCAESRHRLAGAVGAGTAGDTGAVGWWSGRSRCQWGSPRHLHLQAKDRPPGQHPPSSFALGSLLGVTPVKHQVQLVAKTFILHYCTHSLSTDILYALQNTGVTKVSNYWSKPERHKPISI